MTLEATRPESAVSRPAVPMGDGPASSPRTLPGLLREAAGRFGSLPALKIRPGFRLQTWSYARLWRNSGRMAAYLRSQGVVKGDRVVIWAPNSPAWVVAFFGCLRAGAVVVPLDVRSAADFVERVCERTEPKLLFLSRLTPAERERPATAMERIGAALRGTSASGPPRLLLENLETMLEVGDTVDEAPDVAVEPDDIAEIIFTSGTTGDPKGVVLSHWNIVSNVLAANQVFTVDSTHTLLSLLPLSHMLEQTGGLLIPLHGGASIVYPTSRQPNIIFKTLAEHHVTTLVLVPQVLQLFMNGIEREVERQGKQHLWAWSMRVAPRLPVPLRRLLFRNVLQRLGGKLWLCISGGAALDPALAAKWEALGVTVLQGYGTTEASPVVTFNSPEHRRAGSVGRALPGVQVRLAPDGEVEIAGPNVTRGYWRNPDATAAAFDAGWYRTGDLGEVDRDGFLFLKGRKKDLIVLANGQNVYPEDVEHAINRQPGIVEGVVVPLPRDGSPTVHAALLVQEGADPAAIIRGANALLADHQQIAGWTLWPDDDFPRTHTMKVKKPLVLQRLAELNEGPPAIPAEAVGRRVQAALGGVQRILVEVLGVPPELIGAEHRLGSDLNLDSLARVELLSAVESELGVYVDESLVTPQTTVAELERLIAAGGRTGRELPNTDWARWRIVASLRATLQRLFVFPPVDLLYDWRIVGAENLVATRGPVLIVANHTLHLDNAILLRAFPAARRRRLAIAAAADTIFANPVQGWLAALLGNAFPLVREGGIRPSLEYMGRLLDHSWSILIYPEGKLTVGGPIQPFKPGAGLLAVEAGIPVVPVKVDPIHMGLPDGRWLGGRSRVEVRVGAPITFLPTTNPMDATAALEAAVREL